MRYSSLSLQFDTSTYVANTIYRSCDGDGKCKNRTVNMSHSLLKQFNSPENGRHFLVSLSSYQLVMWSKIPRRHVQNPLTVSTIYSHTCRSLHRMSALPNGVSKKVHICEKFIAIQDYFHVPLPWSWIAEDRKVI
jgi:hypothetical protein